MMTSSFAVSRDHPNAVAIVRYLPRWQPFRGRVYQALAPTRGMFRMSDADFDRAFAAHLAKLDPRKVYDDLGPDAVLLCYEQVGYKCHRRAVAEYLEAALGIEIPELGIPRDQTPAYADSPDQPRSRKSKNQLSFLRALLHGMHTL